ncbi:hypothetical protein ABZP36_010302 [Zizania latifolia]
MRRRDGEGGEGQAAEEDDKEDLISLLPGDMSFYVDPEATAWLRRLFSFQRLRKLPLFMFEMKADNLANIYLFLKMSLCPNLARLFVQLPKIRDELFQKNFLDLVTEESQEDGLDNLTVVRIMNFNWYRIKPLVFSFSFSLLFSFLLDNGIFSLLFSDELCVELKGLRDRDRQRRMGLFFFASRAAARFLGGIRIEHPSVSTAALLLTAARCSLHLLFSPRNRLKL